MLCPAAPITPYFCGGWNKTVQWDAFVPRGDEWTVHSTTAATRAISQWPLHQRETRPAHFSTAMLKDGRTVYAQKAGLGGMPGLAQPPVASSSLGC
jgi:hypothetical protein